jgi:predicted RNase H-like nuclease
MAMAEAPSVAGVDGCPAGWAVVFLRLDGDPAPEFAVFPDFAALLADARQPGVIAVDMPIGLPERIGPGGRGPERLVRPLLGERQSSVFSVPSRAAVMENDYGRACAVALATSEPPKKVSKQCFHLFPRIREIDRLMTPALEGRVYEAHPELAFWRINDQRPVPVAKKVKGRANPPGIAFRTELLAAHGYRRAFLDQLLPRGVGRDDFLDAAVLGLAARRIAGGEGRSFPGAPDRDGKGLRIAIWT